MTSQLWVPDRHHRHHRHQPLSFKEIAVTQVRPPSSPCSSPLPWAGAGDEVGDVSVTRFQAFPSPRNRQKHKAFRCQKAAW